MPVLHLELQPSSAEGEQRSAFSKKLNEPRRPTLTVGLQNSTSYAKRNDSIKMFGTLLSYLSIAPCQKLDLSSATLELLEATATVVRTRNGEMWQLDKRLYLHIRNGSSPTKHTNIRK